MSILLEPSSLRVPDYFSWYMVRGIIGGSGGFDTRIGTFAFHLVTLIESGASSLGFPPLLFCAAQLGLGFHPGFIPQTWRVARLVDSCRVHAQTDYYRAGICPYVASSVQASSIKDINHIHIRTFFFQHRYLPPMTPLYLDDQDQHLLDLNDLQVLAAEGLV